MPSAGPHPEEVDFVVLRVRIREFLSSCGVSDELKQAIETEVDQMIQEAPGRSDAGPAEICSWVASRLATAAEVADALVGAPDQAPIALKLWLFDRLAPTGNTGRPVNDYDKGPAAQLLRLVRSWIRRRE